MLLELARHTACLLVVACRGDPLRSVATVFVFYMFFNVVEAVVEELLFGERFLHWFDLVFGVLFISYACLVVRYCRVYVISEDARAK